MESLDHLLEQTAARIAKHQRFPESTYRVQFHAGFTFRDATDAVSYLAELGISHLYASPFLKACAGSRHGYDITDHGRLNPEIGSDEDYEALSSALDSHGLGQLLDIVPNHMGIATNDNAWWNDVLENGPSSTHAATFDIAWNASPRPELRGRILLPVLGEPYGKALESGNIVLLYNEGAFKIEYFGRRFPVSPCSYDAILRYRLEHLLGLLDPADPALGEYMSILTAIGNLPKYGNTDPARSTERQREKEVIKRRLAVLTHENPVVRAFVEENVAACNGSVGVPQSFDQLDFLLDRQPYRLSYWRVASDEINYRRFFDVDGLAAINMELETVFEASHRLLFGLIESGKVHGLRIDHPDGLFNPRQYLERLQKRYLLWHAREEFEASSHGQSVDWAEIEHTIANQVSEPSPVFRQASRWPPLYVVVEKILGEREGLPADWPVHGTSGYDFLNLVNGLFVNSTQAEVFTRLYQDLVHNNASFAEILYQKKFLILQVSMASELSMLALLLDRIAQKHRWSRDFTLNSLRHALREVIACFPVYRSYLADGKSDDADFRNIHRAVERAKAKNAALSGDIFNFVRDVLLPRDTAAESDDDRIERRRFVGKFEQLTAPIMAKGMEDTAFYVYNRLLSLNEVGGHPERFGVSPAALHEYLRGRQANFPWSLSATSTHDTKRSEDVRARLNVLSEMPDEWRSAVSRWSALNQPLRPMLDDLLVPDANEEYLLYQTLLGAWPLEPYSAAHFADFVERVRAYMVKALHEAKVHSSWINPNAAYDSAIQEFVGRILNAESNAVFFQDFRVFQRRVSHFGLLNSLAQTLLKLTAPGVPDIYQGSELWDFSLVDPDNRRPVDFAHRQQLLSELRANILAAGNDRRGLVQALVNGMEDGRSKLYLIAEALSARGQCPGLFTSGDYVPLEPVGGLRDHLFAFLRRGNERQAIVAIPRLMTSLSTDQQALPMGADVWEDTAIVLPADSVDKRFRNVFTGETVQANQESGRSSLATRDLFKHFPVALLLDV